MNCITIENLTKNFNNLSVLKDINLEIEERSIVGVSGKNGSGKTTFLKLLCGVLLPDKGEIYVYGKDNLKHRDFVKKIISLSSNSENGLYPQLTIYENLKFLSLLYNNKLENIRHWIKYLELDNFLNTKFMFCSSGIKTRLWFISSLIKNPKILLIDELTKSVDFETKQKIYELIKILNQEHKMTIIFVSHNIGEINMLAHKWLHIEEGRIIERI
jgi:ABC-2 type transport system ATP-binding protein